MSFTELQNRSLARNRRGRPRWRLLSTAPLACGAALAVAAPAAAAAVPDVQSLYGQATAAVRAADHGQLAKAVLLEADGRGTDGRPVAAAAQITHWHFVFANPTSGSPYASATIDYASPHGFRPAAGRTSPYLEDVAIPKAPRVSLAMAVSRLRASGHQGAFTAVELRDPLAPHSAGPRYIFTMSQGSGNAAYVSVSATSGRVIS